MHFGVTLHFGFPRLYTGGCLRQRTWDVQVSLHTPFGVIATSDSVAPRWTMDFCQPVVPWITSLSEIHFSAICYKLVCSAKIKHGFLLTFVWVWNEANHHRKEESDKKKLYAKWNDFCDNQSQKWNDVMTSKMNYRSNETNAVTAKWQKSKNAKTRGTNKMLNETTADRCEEKVNERFLKWNDCCDSCEMIWKRQKWTNE